MERATQKLESTALITTSDARGLSTRRVTRPDRTAVAAVTVEEGVPTRGLAVPRTGLGSFGSPTGLGSKPFGG